LVVVLQRGISAKSVATLQAECPQSGRTTPAAPPQVDQAGKLGCQPCPALRTASGTAVRRIWPIGMVMQPNETKPLRVAVINSADFGGGAETIARMLAEGLSERGHDATLWVGRLRGSQNRDASRKTVSSRPGIVREIPCTPRQREVGRRFLDKGFFNLGIPSTAPFCTSAALDDLDLIHMHNIHGHYFSMDALPLLARRAALFWTFHDFFPITGGCAFPHECRRWLSRCGDCPQLGRYPLVTEFERTRRMQTIKRRAFRDLPVTIITPSEHLGRAVRESGVFAQAAYHVIPYGLNTDLFCPDRARARQALNLDLDEPVVLLVAQGLDDPRKGVHHALAALQAVEQPRLTVLAAGDGDPQPIKERLAHHDVRFLGYVSDQTQLARCYQAADLYVFTSLAENFPCVTMEAMSCGTAVLAFDIDGVVEQITPDETGFLVPRGDTQALAQAARTLLHDVPHLREVGMAARDHAVRHWSKELFLGRHERLYRSTCAARFLTVASR
jgi:glycosyltransferase involved in cell wall biosynthesis